MEIKIGRKYTCRTWLSSCGVDLYTIPLYIEGDNVYCIDTYVKKEEEESEIWSVSCFNEGSSLNYFYLLEKKIKNTKLSRKMYPNAKVDGEYLLVEVK